VLQGMIDRLIEVGRCCGMEVNVENTKAMTVSRLLSQTLDMIVQTKPENVEYFNYLVCMTTNGARCRRETKSRTVMQKQHSTRDRPFSPANLT